MHRRKRLRIGPYTDLGGPFIPPRPAGFALVDRTDGKTYFITETAGGATPAIVMTVISATWKDPIYEAFYGPVMPTTKGRIRLFVSSGTLGNETTNDDDNHQKTFFAPIHTRRAGYTPNVYEVIEPANFNIGDTLITKKVT